MADRAQFLMHRTPDCTGEWRLSRLHGRWYWRSAVCRFSYGNRDAVRDAVRQESHLGRQLRELELHGRRMLRGEQGD